MNTKCCHVFVKGERKGESCSITVRSGAPYCSRHSSSHKTSLPLPVGIYDRRSSHSKVDEAHSHGSVKMNEPELHQQSNDELASSMDKAPSLVDVQPESPTVINPTPQPADVGVSVTFDSVVACNNNKIGTCDNPISSKPKMCRVAPRHSLTPGSEMRKYGGSISGAAYNVPIKQNKMCDIHGFMGILETLFQQNATLT